MSHKFKNSWLFIRGVLFFNGLKRRSNHSKDIVKNIISLNIAFLSIVLAYYVAVTSYYSPQIKVAESDRDLFFNHMLNTFDEVNLNGAIPSKSMHYYKNDTLDIEKISSAIGRMSSLAANIYKKKESYEVKDLVIFSWQYMDTLRLIDLIANRPILNLLREQDSSVIRIIPGQNYIPYNDKFFVDISDFLERIDVNAWIGDKNDIRLIEYCSDYSFYSNSGRTNCTWAHEKLDSLRDAYKLNPDYKTQRRIQFWEEDIKENKTRLSRYNNFYDALNSTYKTYIIELSEMNYKLSLFKNILTKLKNIHPFIIWIFVMNLLVPIISFNCHWNDKISILWFIGGLIPYLFIVKNLLSSIY